MKKADLVFIPSPGIGHLVSTVEFSNLLLERNEELSIIVLVMEKGKEHIPKLATHTNICFIELPHVEPPPDELRVKCIEKYGADAIEAHKNCVKDAIVKKILPNSPKLLGLVVDLFCSSMIDVANELGLPSYLFFTSGVSFLGFALYLPHRFDRVGREFEESDPESIVPGYINPVPANVLPNFAYNKDGYISFVNHGRKFRETKGIVVNSFLDLESHAVSSLSTHDLPPIYTVGPLINHKNQNTVKSKNHDEIMKWLDEQPPSTVVFLCFGSAGCFGVSQLKEIAKGLEKSGHRFLWSIRVVSEDKPPKQIENIEHKTILTEGFLDRTKGRGFTCGWVPQLDVLAHKAVGGFVSHCGWNSILESLWFGVPILTWPLYAEQQINAFQMVKDLGLAFEFKFDTRRYSDDIVKADEITKAVKYLMEEDNDVRKKVKDMSVKSRKTLKAGGSSYASVERWIETMLASN
ncbi:hypothetical protein L6164_028908 [Bauhinia variegata]|uniref:Uncharacterized protein n=1 Tax=Bauhinia variegata TaxID=167791 RepID=A0ACB9L8Y1_BAUVA|nr:hypothetical protein L6164_028908 [Bauhinia variegata]